ncbi:MAG: hypothetical protein ACQEQE_05180 [Bacillota bacterium]
MEKFKNFLYDITDFLLGLSIIFIMILVISFKVTDSFSLNLKSIITDDTPSQKELVENENSNTNIEQIVIKPDTNNDSENDSNTSNDEINNSNTEENKNSDKNNQKNNSSNQEVALKEIKLNVKSGTTGYGIAKLLKEKKLIEDTQSFISRVEKRELGSKLRSGEFLLTNKDSMDKIIDKLTGSY